MMTEDERRSLEERMERDGAQIIAGLAAFMSGQARLEITRPLNDDSAPTVIRIVKD